MTPENYSKSKQYQNMLKFLLPLVVVLGVIIIFRGGYEFGQWLYHIRH